MLIFHLIISACANFLPYHISMRWSIYIRKRRQLWGESKLNTYVTVHKISVTWCYQLNKLVDHLISQITEIMSAGWQHRYLCQWVTGATLIMTQLILSTQTLSSTLKNQHNHDSRMLWHTTAQYNYKTTENTVSTTIDTTTKQVFLQSSPAHPQHNRVISTMSAVTTQQSTQGIRSTQ